MYMEQPTKFALKLHIKVYIKKKSHLLASQSLQFFIYKSHSFKLIMY